MAEAKIGTNGIAQRTDVNENNFSLKNKKGRSQEQFNYHTQKTAKVLK